jgi:signal transduction histidine kinase
MSHDEFDPRVAHDAIAIPSIHTAQRTLMAVGTIAATAAVFLLGLTSPTISHAVGVTLAQGVCVVLVFSVGVALATATYFRFGVTSRVYRCCDALEGFTLSWGVAYLIQASSAVHSFFWIFHGVQVLMTALGGYSLVYLVTVCIGPAYLVTAFLWQGDTASAWLSALAGICGLSVYLVITRLSSQRDAALRREAELRQELARVSVARERARISRDLHDSVATELTALVWKVREISDTVPSGQYTHDIVGVAERLRSAIADLRSIVLSLREPEPGFSELERVLERRCRELCGHGELRLSVDGQVENSELAQFKDQVLPICFELVNNAARHAGAGHIELALRMGVRLRIVVSDDGCGLPPAAFHESRGGLQSIRQRAQRLGGSVTLEATLAGTRLIVDLPRPLQQSVSELAAG